MLNCDGVGETADGKLPPPPPPPPAIVVVSPEKELWALLGLLPLVVVVTAEAELCAGTGGGFPASSSRNVA